MPCEINKKGKGANTQKSTSYAEKFDPNPDQTRVSLYVSSPLFKRADQPKWKTQCQLNPNVLHPSAKTRFSSSALELRG